MSTFGKALCKYELVIYLTLQDNRMKSFSIVIIGGVVRWNLNGDVTSVNSFDYLRNTGKKEKKIISKVNNTFKKWRYHFLSERYVRRDMRNSFTIDECWFYGDQRWATRKYAFCVVFSDGVYTFRQRHK